MDELIFRFLIDGTLVSAFALVGDAVRPKSFAGLFGAAPSIALATRKVAEGEKKRRVGLDGTSRGRVAAGIDAVGAAMGTLGLIAFAILIWRFLPGHSSPAILTIAGLAWLAISVLAWRIRKA